MTTHNTIVFKRNTCHCWQTLNFFFIVFFFCAGNCDGIKMAGSRLSKCDRWSFSLLLYFWLVPSGLQCWSEPQHRHSSSPSLSSHSWNPVLLNNELNLSSASGGNLNAALSLVQCFCCPSARECPHMHTLTFAHHHSSFQPQVALWKMLCWLAAERQRGGKKKCAAELEVVKESWWFVLKKEDRGEVTICVHVWAVQKQRPRSSTATPVRGRVKRFY